MNPLRTWIQSTLAEEDAKAAEGKAEAEKQKRLERLEKQIAIVGILDGWGFPTAEAGQFDPDTAEYCVPAVNKESVRFHFEERWNDKAGAYLPALLYYNDPLNTAEEFATILRRAGLEEDIPQGVCHQCFKATNGDNFCSEECQAKYYAPRKDPETDLNKYCQANGVERTIDINA